MTIPTLPLSSGASIPQIGLGTYPLQGDDLAAVIEVAAGLGYRHIDTASRYGNEDGVGAGIRRTGIDREEFFVTTKLDGGYQGEDRAVAGLAASLDRLGLEYVDLLLVHWPLPARDLYVSTWRTFEKLAAEGLARSIGVSNFKPAHLERLAAETGTVPAVNQVQLNPQVTRPAVRAYDAAHGIVTSAYTPIGGRETPSLRDEPVLAEIGERYGKTPTQVVLRWHVQLGVVPIPKSGHPGRLAENIDVFDFTLDDDDLAAIATLSHGPDAGNDSDTIGH